MAPIWVKVLGKRDVGNNYFKEVILMSCLNFIILI